MAPAYEFEAHPEGDGVHIRVEGEIDIRCALEVKSRMVQALDLGSGAVHFDLRGINFMDSTGLDMLAKLVKRLCREKRPMSCVTNERMASILRMTGLAPKLNVSVERTTPCTVLLIDDEPEEVNPLIEDLTREGYRVLFATGGQSGLETITKEKPDIILCDLEMPGLDGYDVLEAVAADPETRDLPFLLMNDEWTTGPNGNWMCARNSKTADCHLPKPFDPREVLTFVRRMAEATAKTTSTSGS